MNPQYDNYPENGIHNTITSQAKTWIHDAITKHKKAPIHNAEIKQKAPIHNTMTMQNFIFLD